MAILSIPENNITIIDPIQIRHFFNSRAIFFDQWHCEVEFEDLLNLPISHNKFPPALMETFLRYPLFSEFSAFFIS
mgnify:CR=1 FL=1